MPAKTYFESIKESISQFVALVKWMVAIMTEFVGSWKKEPALDDDDLEALSNALAE